MKGVAALARVAAELRGEGGLLADAVIAPPAGTTAPHGDRVAEGDRVASAREQYAFAIEAIREGHLVHSAAGRIIDTPDSDLALLAGDRLYALGLSRLAQLGDLPAIAALADVIAQCARAQATGDEALAEAAWDAGVRAVGWGPRA